MRDMTATAGGISSPHPSGIGTSAQFESVSPGAARRLGRIAAAAKSLRGKPLAPAHGSPMSALKADVFTDETRSMDGYSILL